MPKVLYRFEGRELTADAKPGDTLLDAAEACGAREGHACGGVCACSTCHFWVRQGYASLGEPEDGETLEDLFGRAECALHAAKREGRNRVVLAQPLQKVTSCSNG